MEPATNPTERFTTRVENYLRYRPGYPAAILDLLASHCGLSGQSVFADIGSGTGILAKLFLQNGNTVYGVEPNTAMRTAAQELLKTYPNFISINGAAESTTLPASTVDFVIAGQAFHWFDRTKARLEFRRILRREGWVVLIWNERLLDSTAFLRAYEELLLISGIDYEQVRHDRGDQSIVDFFAPGSFIRANFANVQELDLEAFKGRVFSASYTPEPGHLNYKTMVEGLEKIFLKHSENGIVAFEYNTNVYFGQLPEKLK